MRQASERIPDSAEKTVRDIGRATRRHQSAEEKIRIVLQGLRGEVSIAELCRKAGINQNLYYRWSKEFLEAGKNGSLATPRVKRPRMRSRSSRLKHASSRRALGRNRKPHCSHL
jgi:transposase-like protein